MKIKVSELTGAALEWTYTSDSCGYMLYKAGIPQGGARTLGTATHTSDGRRRSYVIRKADSQMHSATAARICHVRNLEFRELSQSINKLELT